ncbi:hypothetical protein L798_11918 [Zootermopsis nevadensis]|uniref:Uncharacterized protein n=1 Tax=Zootermopsis nevadensis TaxID=136037 RepID=A0A067QX61_ZOONE|nr:hypothetical protein L798_11918 [Zootermopsis nevadensis]
MADSSGLRFSEASFGGLRSVTCAIHLLTHFLSQGTYSVSACTTVLFPEEERRVALFLHLCKQSLYPLGQKYE